MRNDVLKVRVGRPIKSLENSRSKVDKLTKPMFVSVRADAVGGIM